MRRALGALTILALIAVTPAALAVSEWENYKDKFSTGGYSGNDGSLQWNGSWKEVGESNGPGSGAVRVEGSGCSGQCLVIDAGLLGVATGAYRLADTGDFTDAKLSYLVAFDGGLLGLLNASLTVAVTSNGGASWSTVDSILLGSGSGTQSRSVGVTGFRHEQFGIRFTATGAAGAKVLIDDVEVAGNVPLPTTTTTTTTTTTSTSSTTTTTTTTTLPKLTTTTLPKLTTTTLPKLTTTTLPSLISTTSTTTTTVATTTTSPTSTTTSGDDGFGTNTTTTTTEAAAGPGGGPDDPGGGNGEGDDGSGEGSGSSERTSGLRQTSVGVGGNFDSELFGSQPEVLGFEIAAGFSDAVELVEASWFWVLALALLIAGALIKGIDRRVSVPLPADQKSGG